jgi:3-methyladenine DNA glycosylase AlkD
VDAVVGTLVEAVRRALAEAADPVKAPDMQRYIKSSMPFRGINATPLRRIVRRVFEVHQLTDETAWREAVLTLYDDACYREERYAAIELTGHRFYRDHQLPDVLDLYRHLVVTGAWWDLVDPLASNRVGPVLRAFPDEVAPVIRRWAEEDDLWLRRTAVISQLGSKVATDTELLREVLVQNLLGTLHGDAFFIRKAVGWALRQHARQDPEWVLHFVAEHDDRLSNLSRREALKHLS